MSFHLIEPIGEGGQGWVFRAAYDEPEGPLVVVKVLRPDVLSEESIPRFLREAEVLRKLGAAQTPSPCVVRFYDHGIHPLDMPDGEVYALPFTVLEYVPGTTLARLIEQAGRGLALPRVRRLFRQVARALSLVHAAQVVHRDLKPSNLLVSSDGGREVVKLSDFGLVKRFDVDTQRTQWLAGASVGYAPPEQFEVGNRRVSVRTDVFAFAAVLFEALSGREAFRFRDGDSVMHMLSVIMTGARPRLLDAAASLAPELAARPDLVASIDREIERALRADPAERHESVFELWQRVEGLLVAAGAPTGARGLSASFVDCPTLSEGSTPDLEASHPARAPEVVRIEPARAAVGVEPVATRPSVGVAHGEPIGGGFRAVVAASLERDRARAISLGAQANGGHALGRSGLWRLVGGAWAQVPVAAPIDFSAFSGVLTTSPTECALFGERGALCGVQADGSVRAWASPDPDLVWRAASLCLYPPEISMVGERREAGRPRVAVVGVLRPGQPVIVRNVEGVDRLLGCTRLSNGLLLLCGEGGELATLSSTGELRKVAWGRTGHLLACVGALGGGAHVVGGGGHALLVSGAGDARLEPMQTTRDLSVIACSPQGVAWAGGADGRLVRRGPAGWARVPLPPQATGVVRALHAGDASLVVALDDGLVLEGPSA